MSDQDWMTRDSTVPVFAAVGGAVIAVLAADGVTPAKAIGMVVAGAILGAFVVPGLAEYAGIGSLKLVSALSCLVGMLGLQAVRVLTSQFDGIARRGLAAAVKRAGLGDGNGGFNMMFLGVWLSAPTTLMLYTVANVLLGGGALAVMVELPRRASWWITTLRGMLAAIAIASLGATVATVKLLLVASASSDAVLFELAATTFAIRWCTALIMGWGAAYLLWHREPMDRLSRMRW